MIYVFFNDTATTEIYTLSLHDALPIFPLTKSFSLVTPMMPDYQQPPAHVRNIQHEKPHLSVPGGFLSERTLKQTRSEEHTSELQSRQYLVCRLLLEKKNQHQGTTSQLR